MTDTPAEARDGRTYLGDYAVGEAVDCMQIECPECSHQWPVCHPAADDDDECDECGWSL